MRDALYDNAKRAVNEYPRDRDDSIRRDTWLWDYPAQVLNRLDNRRRIPPSKLALLYSPDESS